MRLLGHPVHPMLVHFPIALLTVGSVCDALALGGVPGVTVTAWLAIGAGSAFALLTMLAGLLDYAALDEAALPAAGRHMALMATAWLLYVASFVLRSDGFAPCAGLPISAAATGFVGLILLIAGAWQGSELVYRHGAGMRR